MSIPYDLDWKEFFIYRKDGVLVWKNRPREHFNTDEGCIIFNRNYAGKVVGGKPSHGYLYARITVEKSYKIPIHRIVYEIFNGVKSTENLVVDHIDGNSMNNKIENLRVCLNSENLQNQRSSKGYSWHKKNQKWTAQIRLDKKLIHLGSYDCEEDARLAYLKAKKEYHPDFMPISMLEELGE